MVDGREELVEFLSKYCELIEGQLSTVSSSLATTVEQVMEGVAEMSSNSLKAQKTVERALEETYLSPNPDFQLVFNDIDASTSRLLSEVQSPILPVNDNEHEYIGKEDDLLRRIKACDETFSRNMYELKELDNELKAIMLGIVGALSAEDVIAQKLNHIIMALKVLQIGLSYTLIDFASRSTKPEIRKMISDVQKYTLEQFVSQDEKNQYYQIFKSIKNPA